MTGAVPLPPDAQVVELRPEALVFRTRECLLPGALVEFTLVMEGHPLRLAAPVEACLVVEKDKNGHTFHVRLSFAGLPGSDQTLISLFIGKGRGSAQLVPTAAAK